MPTSVSLGTFVLKWEQGDMSVQSQAVGVTGRGTRPDQQKENSRATANRRRRRRPPPPSQTTLSVSSPFLLKRVQTRRPLR